MRIMQRFFSTTILVSCLTFFIWAAAYAADLKITEMAVTTKIVKGNPVDSVRRISSSSVKALFCFTRLKADADENSAIKHIWYRNDQVVAEYPLPVKGRQWRTYSRKTIERGYNGDWRVDAIDADGNILKSVSFRIN